jgi:hypothetical protein
MMGNYRAKLLSFFQPITPLLFIAEVAEGLDDKIFLFSECIN